MSPTSSLPQASLGDEHRRSRFVREAKAASALNHPNIVTIYDISQAEAPQIWVVPYPTGKASKATNDLNTYRGVSVTADASALVTTQSNERGDMWTTAPRAGIPSQLTQTSSNGDGAFGITWTPEGKLLYCSSAERDL